MVNHHITCGVILGVNNYKKLLVRPLYNEVNSFVLSNVQEKIVKIPQLYIQRLLWDSQTLSSTSDVFKNAITL